jgi:hypothetical protein
VNTLHYPNSHFVNFTADNKNLLIIQPYKQRLIFRNIITGKQTLHKLAINPPANAAAIIQSVNKAWLAVPMASASANDTTPFLLINGKTGAVVY